MHEVDYRKFSREYVAPIEKELCIVKGSGKTLISQSIREYLLSLNYKNSILIANHESDTGKSTTALCMALILTQLYGKKTLLIELTASHSLAGWLGVDDESILELLNSNGELKEDSEYSKSISHFPLLELSSSKRVRELELTMITMEDWELALKLPMQKLTKRYDYILIDSSTSTNLMLINSYLAADWLLLPVRDGGDTEGRVEASLDFMRRIKKKYSSKIEFLGYFHTVSEGEKSIEKGGNLENVRRLPSIRKVNKVEELMNSLKTEIAIEHLRRVRLFTDYELLVSAIIECVES